MPQNAQETLKRCENEIKNNRTEKLYFVGADGRVLYNKTDRRNNRVEFDSRFFPLLNGAIMTHNHPQGLSFSAEDIVTGLVRGNAREIRATSAKCTYRMSIGENRPNEVEVITTYNEVQQKAQRERFDIIYNRLKQLRGRIPNREYNKKLDKFNRQYSDYIIRNVAKKLRLNYGVEK